MSESHWYNPMSWALPDVSHAEVPWESVREYSERFTADDLRDMRAAVASNSAAAVARRLEEMIDVTGQKKEAFADWMGTLQTQNMQAISKAVDDYQSNVEIAKFVRDASAEGLMVGASVMTGGAAVAALGGASFFKGACKFQDTDSVGAAVMEGVGSFAFAYVKLGKSFSFKENMVLAFVQAPYKAGTELVGGESMGKALLKGGLKLTGPVTEAFFKLPPAKTLFDKVAVPIVITYQGQNVAATVLAKFTDKVQAKGVEVWATKNPSEKPQPAGGARGQIVAQATLSDKYLLYLAFVNMEKGIGRGW